MFWSSEKRHKGFKRINDKVKSSLQKLTLSHTDMIWYPIVNDYIKLRLYEIYEGAKTQLRQKVLLQVSLHDLHIKYEIYAT